jgi:hypothetical protein
MNTGKAIFSQAMEFLPLHEFRRCVNRYQGDYKAKKFSCLDQFLCMAFAQLTYRESLRDIQTCLRSMQNKLYHMGIRGNVSRSTLADANENRDWRIYADFAQVLIHTARDLYRNDDFGLDLQNTVYALDATIIDLCLSVFPWAKFRKTKAGVKLHTVLDLRGNIPTFIEITDALLHDVNILDVLVAEPGACYVMDRGYIDFFRLYRWKLSGVFFVVRSRKKLNFKRVYSHKVDKSTGLRCDQTIVLTGSFKDYPEQLRRICFFDAKTGNRITLLTDDFSLPALIIAQIYKCRWQIELFFKWIKQHLRIKSFFGTSENAVKIQIWIAISVYVLVAIIKKRLNIEHSLYAILQVLSVTSFEKAPLTEILSDRIENDPQNYDNDQLHFDF